MTTINTFSGSNEKTRSVSNAFKPNVKNQVERRVNPFQVRTPWEKDDEVVSKGGP
jgi:hypothetical protein